MIPTQLSTKGFVIQMGFNQGGCNSQIFLSKLICKSDIRSKKVCPTIIKSRQDFVWSYRNITNRSALSVLVLSSHLHILQIRHFLVLSNSFFNYQHTNPKHQTLSYVKSNTFMLCVFIVLWTISILILCSSVSAHGELTISWRSLF